MVNSVELEVWSKKLGIMFLFDWFQRGGCTTISPFGKRDFHLSVKFAVNPCESISWKRSSVGRATDF